MGAGCAEPRPQRGIGNEAPERFSQIGRRPRRHEQQRGARPVNPMKEWIEENRDGDDE